MRPPRAVDSCPLDLGAPTTGRIPHRAGAVGGYGRRGLPDRQHHPAAHDRPDRQLLVPVTAVARYLDHDQYPELAKTNPLRLHRRRRGRRPWWVGARVLLCPRGRGRPSDRCSSCAVINSFSPLVPSLQQSWCAGSWRLSATGCGRRFWAESSFPSCTAGG